MDTEKKKEVQDKGNDQVIQQKPPIQQLKEKENPRGIGLWMVYEKLVERKVTIVSRMPEIDKEVRTKILKHVEDIQYT